MEKSIKIKIIGIITLIILGILTVSHLVQLALIEPSIPSGAPTTCEDRDGDLIQGENCLTQRDTFTDSEEEAMEHHAGAMMIYFFLLAINILGVSIIDARY